MSDPYTERFERARDAAFQAPGAGASQMPDIDAAIASATRVQLTPEIERAMYQALAEAEPGRHHAAVRRGLTAAFRAAGFEVTE